MTLIADKRPKVLFVMHNHPEIRPGGSEGYALSLYKAIKDFGEFEPVFLGRTGAASPFVTEEPIHRYSPITPVNEDPNQYLIYTDLEKFDYLMQRSSDKETATTHYRDFLLAQRPDVVHFQHNYLIGYDWIRVTRNTLPEVPIVLTFHEYLAICHHDGQMVRTANGELCREQTPRRCHECFPWIEPQKFFLRTRFIQSHLNLANAFTAPSEYVRDRYVDWGLQADKFRIVPYAMPPVERPPEPDPGRPRNRFAFFGQCTPHKGADVLLKAMALLGDDFDGHLVIHGANLEYHVSDFQDQLRRLLEATSNTVTFAGPYDHSEELTKLMMATDWTVVPSVWWETGPLVVFESFQHGRPVICSDIGEMSNNVEHEVSGLQFPVGDPEKLAETLARAAGTPGLWDELHAGIPPVYDITEHTKVVTDIYKRLLARRRSPGGASIPPEAQEVLT
jgi:glycosyltransferase involved in cell wall biosynthesis